MKTTKKMVLIPFSKYERLMKVESINQSPNQPLNQPLNQPQQEHEIDDVDNTQTNETNTKIQPDININYDAEHGLKQSQILDHIPLKQKSNANVLLDYIINHTEIRWSKTGELVIGSEHITHSHISDLIKDAVVIHKHFKPIGIDQFYNNIGNIPITLIKNPERRQLIINNRSNKTIDNNNTSLTLDSTDKLPPPGIPNSESRSLDNKKQNYSVKKKISKTKKSMSWKNQWRIM